MVSGKSKVRLVLTETWTCHSNLPSLPNVALSAGVVEVFRICSLEEPESIVRAAQKNMTELGGAVTNYRLAFQKYLTGLDTAMVDYARRLINKRRDSRMITADEEARAAARESSRVTAVDERRCGSNPPPRVGLVWPLRDLGGSQLIEPWHLSNRGLQWMPACFRNIQSS